jgi:hypothetical protein
MRTGPSPRVELETCCVHLLLSYERLGTADLVFMGLDKGERTSTNESPLAVFTLRSRA